MKLSHCCAGWHSNSKAAAQPVPMIVDSPSPSSHGSCLEADDPSPDSDASGRSKRKRSPAHLPDFDYSDSPTDSDNAKPRAKRRRRAVTRRGSSC